MPAGSTLAAEAIIFSINSAIKLSNNLRQAYAQTIQTKEIILPLPKFDPKINLDTVIFFFNKHDSFIRQWDRLAELHKKADSDDEELSKEELEEYQGFYLTFKAQQEGYGPYREMSATELISLFKIRQWKKGEAPVNVLQLVAGTMVEIGIDYFTQVPGALNLESAHGRVIHQFLSAFDEIDFAENPDIKKEFSDRLLPRLFAAAAESVASLSNEIAGDEKLQAFIKETAKGIAKDIYKRVEDLNAVERDEAVHWGQLVLRSMINNAGHYVLSAPQSIFGTNDAVSQIIESSGLVLLDEILGKDPDKVSFRNALSPDSLDRLARATLSVIAEHPNVISGKRGVKEIIAGVAAAVTDQSVVEQGFLPELIRIVLEQSAGKLELFWKETPQGSEHLLVLALSQLLGSISEKEEADVPWKPMLTKKHLLSILEELVDDVANNPGWVLDKVGDQSLMAEVLNTTFDALLTLPKGERLNPDMVRHIIRLNLETTLVNKRVLDKVHWGTEEEEVAILTKALEMVFAVVFPTDAPPDVRRLELLTDLLDYTSEVILRQYPDKRALVLLDLILFNSGVDYSLGFDEELSDQLIDAALQVLSSRPELVAKPEAFQKILAGIAGALDSAKVKQPGLAPRLVQLLLEHTATNVHLLFDPVRDEPRHLLLTAMEHLLKGLAATDGSGNWKPGMTSAQVEDLLSVLLDEMVDHPFWITGQVNQDSLMAEVLDTVFLALETIPKQDRLSPETLEMLLQLSLRAVASSPRVLQKVKFAEDDQEKEILLRGLELVFAYASSPGDGKANRMLLLPDLISYTLEVLISKYPDKRALILIDLILFEYNGIDYSQGFQPEIVEQLVDSALSALSQHPELVTNDQVLHHLISHVAGALHQSGLQQPDLLPELIRLCLESTAEHIDLLLDDSRPTPRHLFIVAAWQVLEAIGQQPEEGKWRPRLSNDQILEIIGVVYDTILENPQWAIEDPYFFKLLEAVFVALQYMPDMLTIPYFLIYYIIEDAIAAASLQRELLVEIETAEGVKKLRLQYSLEGFVTVLYGENGEKEAAWYLSQSHIVKMLVNYYLMMIAATPASVEDMDAAQEQLRQAIAMWKVDFSQNLEEILEKLGQP